MRRLLALAVLGWLVAGTVTACSKPAPDPGPSCAQVVDHMLEVTKQQLTGHGDMELGNRKTMIAQCEQRTLSADQRRCLVAAKDLTAIAACSPARPAPPARSAPAAAPPSAPAGAATGTP